MTRGVIVAVLVVASLFLCTGGEEIEVPLDGPLCSGSCFCGLFTGGLDTYRMTKTSPSLEFHTVCATSLADCCHINCPPAEGCDPPALPVATCSCSSMQAYSIQESSGGTVNLGGFGATIGIGSNWESQTTGTCETQISCTPCRANRAVCRYKTTRTTFTYTEVCMDGSGSAIQFTVDARVPVCQNEAVACTGG